MYRINVVFLIILFLLVGCSKQETVQATGEGEYWKGHMIYEVTDSELYDRGGIEYTGDEELIYVTYKVVTGLGGQGGELYPQENQTAISFGMGSSNHPPTKEKVIIELNHSYIEIEWRTNTGEYKEKVELNVN